MQTHPGYLLVLGDAKTCTYLPKRLMNNNYSRLRWVLVSPSTSITYKITIVHRIAEISLAIRNDGHYSVRGDHVVQSTLQSAARNPVGTRMGICIPSVSFSQSNTRIFNSSTSFWYSGLLIRFVVSSGSF